MSISRIIILKVRLIVIAFIIAAGIFLISGMARPNIGSQGLQADAEEATLLAEEPQQSRAEQVMRALVAAYPRRVLKAEFRNDDWAVLLRDTWFYYADGRLLPEELLYRVSEYRPVLLNYRRELPPWTTPTPEQAARFRELVETRDANQFRRSHYFFDALYRAHSHDESYTRVKTIRFLGNPVTVHYAIIEDLVLVEEHILAAAKTDSRVRAWKYNIRNLAGWNWRNVAGTQSRSFHSYGAAIDIIPRALGGRAVYWRWAGPNWWSIPYERRYHPPAAVIKAFESYGFIWGGNWLFFDTIHFEYRPEVLILNGVELATLR
ncbi:MAG: M15 family metallopeptidase [Spirochaetaceae bacterium]|nr:M15 family metallopeptidase [Spirochaetaceae bacterium]